MHAVIIGILIAFSLALMGVLGDYFIKLSSLKASPYLTWMFLVGLLIYGLTAFGWVYAFKYLKVSTLGVVYSVTTVLALTLLGVLYFKETLNMYELLGIILGVASIVLLVKFA